MFINCLLILQFVAIILADDVIETIENRQTNVDHKNEAATELNSKSGGCPSFNMFSPCECNEVSFDGKEFQTQISCKGIDGKKIQSAFHNAATENSVHLINTTYDILEIKDVHSLNLCCDDLTKGFKFRTIKITDSSLMNINENSFDSTSQFTKEFVLMDIHFLNNLDDGQKIFNLVKKFDNLEGIYIITSNLRELPQNALITNGRFGQNLQIIRICNSLISKLYDLTFAHLTNLLWIDLVDNRIDQISANTFTIVNANSEITLRISLSGNRLTTKSIEEGAFSDIKRSVDVYLNDNKIDTLKETVWSRLMNSEKNVLVHLKNNPLICDCRHHWLHVHKKETELHIKEASCENGLGIFSKNFGICEKQPLLDPFGDVYKKCCRQIQYKNKPSLVAHEAVLITESDHHENLNHNDRLVEKTVISKSHHDDFKQVKEDVRYSDLGVKEHHADIKQHADLQATKHLDLPVTKHINVQTIKHVDVPIIKHLETIKHINAPVITRVDHVNTSRDLHNNDHLDREIITNERIVVLPPKISRLLSPAVIVKKPLKYRRLVSTTSQRIQHPVHHVVYGESSVPHIELVKVNGEKVTDDF